MTLTYLIAYFFTPAIVRFNLPILNVPFMRIVEYIWPCEFSLSQSFSLRKYRSVCLFLVCAILSSVPISILHIHE